MPRLPVRRCKTGQPVTLEQAKRFWFRRGYGLKKRESLAADPKFRFEKRGNAVLVRHREGTTLIKCAHGSLSMEHSSDWPYGRRRRGR